MAVLKVNHLTGLGHAIRQIVSGAITPGGVIDVFQAAGLQKPDISLLSEEFLVEVRDMPQKNLAVELLQRLMNDEISSRARANVVQSRKFSEMLTASLMRYQARSTTTAHRGADRPSKGHLRRPIAGRQSWPQRRGGRFLDARCGTAAD